jgi:dTDP-4-amino-4,6-dideoxygalactose transaminase
MANGKKTYLLTPHMSDEGYEMEFVREAFETNWIAPLGKNVDEFEKELAAYVGASHAAALTSGTVSIHMALKAVGVGPGDVVFCPTFTFSATANPILYQGATPVFIDSDEASWNMSPEALDEAFRKYESLGRLPKAVLVVHLYGICAQMDAILAICGRYGVPVIEDAAESLGARYKGRHVGTFGRYGVFSFNGNKIITTSGGGMLVSEERERIEKVRFWASQSKDPARHYQHSEIGYNYKMSNVVAGIGRGQLKVIDQRIRKKEEIFRRYQRELEKLDGVRMMPVLEDTSPIYWLSCMTTGSKVSPYAIMDALEKENVETRPLWKPLHLQPFFESFDHIGGKVSERLFDHGICLPSDTKMTEEEQMAIIGIIRALWE